MAKNREGSFRGSSLRQSHCSGNSLGILARQQFDERCKQCPLEAAAQIESSSSTRWAQVCRARIVSSRSLRARPPPRAQRAGGGAPPSWPLRRRRRGSRGRGGAEQAFAILPPRRNQRNAAGQRLKHADGGDPGAASGRRGRGARAPSGGRAKASGARSFSSQSPSVPLRTEERQPLKS